MKVKGIIIIVLIILAVILIAQNTEVVPVQILFWQILMSRIVLIALMLVLGFGIGFILAKVTGRKRSPPKEN
ncbi:MAG: LapA family protein [candidate division WOR-3 bacterium]|nr:MAG: LapA family protein [candidate division WOR-3 bacterium]